MISQSRGLLRFESKRPQVERNLFRNSDDSLKKPNHSALKCSVSTDTF
jgi:hypothetical protein